MVTPRRRYRCYCRLMSSQLLGTARRNAHPKIRNLEDTLAAQIVKGSRYKINTRHCPLGCHWSTRPLSQDCTEFSLGHMAVGCRAADHHLKMSLSGPRKNSIKAA